MLTKYVVAFAAFAMTAMAGPFNEPVRDVAQCQQQDMEAKCCEEIKGVGGLAGLGLGCIDVLNVVNGCNNANACCSGLICLPIAAAI